MRKLILVALGVFAIVTVATPAAANVITNPGFETCAGYVYPAPGNPAGWTRTSATQSGCVTQITAPGMVAMGFPPSPVTPFGTYMGELRGDVDQALTQNFVVAGGPTPISFSYHLSAFDFAPVNDGFDWFRVVLDGSSIFAAGINTGVGVWGTFGWNTFSSTLNLTPGAHTLQFCIDTTSAGTGFLCPGGNIGSLNPALWAHVDKVSVPEPGALALLGLSLAAAGLRRRFVGTGA